MADSPCDCAGSEACLLELLIEAVQNLNLNIELGDLDVTLNLPNTVSWCNPETCTVMTATVVYDDDGIPIGPATITDTGQKCNPGSGGDIVDLSFCSEETGTLISVICPVKWEECGTPSLGDPVTKDTGIPCKAIDWQLKCGCDLDTCTPVCWVVGVNAAGEVTFPGGAECPTYLGPGGGSGDPDPDPDPDPGAACEESTATYPQQEATDWTASTDAGGVLRFTNANTLSTAGQAFIDAICACIDNGGAATVTMVDQAGANHVWTATGCRIDNAGSDFEGSGDEGAAFKVISATAACVCPDDPGPPTGPSTGTNGGCNPYAVLDPQPTNVSVEPCSNSPCATVPEGGGEINLPLTECCVPPSIADADRWCTAGPFPGIEQGGQILLGGNVIGTGPLTAAESLALLNSVDPGWVLVDGQLCSDHAPDRFGTKNAIGCEYNPDGTIIGTCSLVAQAWLFLYSEGESPTCKPAVATKGCLDEAMLAELQNIPRVLPGQSCDIPSYTVACPRPPCPPPSYDIFCDGETKYVTVTYANAACGIDGTYEAAGYFSTPQVLTPYEAPQVPQICDDASISDQECVEDECGNKWTCTTVITPTGGSTTPIIETSVCVPYVEPECPEGEGFTAAVFIPSEPSLSRMNEADLIGLLASLGQSADVKDNKTDHVKRILAIKSGATSKTETTSKVLARKAVAAHSASLAVGIKTIKHTVATINTVLVATTPTEGPRPQPVGKTCPCPCGCCDTGGGDGGTGFPTEVCTTCDESGCAGSAVRAWCGRPDSTASYSYNGISGSSLADFNAKWDAAGGGRWIGSDTGTLGGECHWFCPAAPEGTPFLINGVDISGTGQFEIFTPNPNPEAGGATNEKAVRAKVCGMDQLIAAQNATNALLVANNALMATANASLEKLVGCMCGDCPEVEAEPIKVVSLSANAIVLAQSAADMYPAGTVLDVSSADGESLGTVTVGQGEAGSANGLAIIKYELNGNTVAPASFEAAATVKKATRATAIVLTKGK